MNVKKNQLGVLLRAVLLLIFLMILLRSLESPKFSMPLAQHYHPVASPVFQKTNLFCLNLVCSRYIQPTHCPCRPLRQGLINHHKILSGPIDAPENERYCQWQSGGEEGTYRFIKYDDLKKRVKRIIRRWFRIK